MKLLKLLPLALVAVALCLASTCFTPAGFAQDPSAPQTESADSKSTEPESTPPAAPQTEATGEESTGQSLVELMNSWQEMDAQLKALEAEYAGAAPARRTQIKEQHTELVKKAREVVSQLRQKAIETYQQNPNGDEAVVRLLVGMLTDDLHKGRVEDFFTLGKVLIEGQIDLKHFQALYESNRLTSFGVEYSIDELVARYQDQKKDDLPRAVIKTSYGDIEIELFEDSAPNHVANFISLASRDFYDGSKWHRVDPSVNVVQGGQPKDGKELDYTIAGEWNHPQRRRHFKGSVGAARTPDPNSASSQFYIVTDRVPEFDVPGNSYTVFGRVISGMEFVHQIKQGDEMLEVEIIRKRDHDYVPVPYKPADKTETPASGETPPTDGSDGGADK